MSAITTRFDGIDCHISRSGYTGEDGYEISCKAKSVRAIAERLLSEPSMKLIALGRATRCGSRPGFVSMATTSTPARRRSRRR